HADYVYSPYDRWNLIRRRRSVSSTFDETRYVLRDYLDPVAIIQTDGTVDERYGYDAFGPVRIMDRDFDDRGSSVCAWNWLFHGEFIDTETGPYNYGYRYYHPQFGRLIPREPIGEEGGMNLYGFVGNDGVNDVDALGLKPPTKPRSFGRYRLSYRTEKLEAGDCGKHEWVIAFLLSEATSSGGMVIQKVTYKKWD